MQAAVEAKQVLLRQAYKQATEAEAQCKQLQQKLHDALEHSRCVTTLHKVGGLHRCCDGSCLPARTAHRGQLHAACMSLLWES